MSTQINEFTLTRLTSEAHAQFHELINTQIVVSGAKALHLETLASPYAAAVALEIAAINRPIPHTPISITDIKDLRDASDTFYCKIVIVVNIFAIAAPTAELEAFTEAINVYVAQYKDVAANQGIGDKKVAPVAVDETLDSFWKYLKGNALKYFIRFSTFLCSLRIGKHS